MTQEQSETTHFHHDQIVESVELSALLKFTSFYSFIDPTAQ